MHAMPLMIIVLCVLAIAYRYYSAFLAAKVATLDDRRQTPAYRFEDGQNYHPISKWVLFGHHFAAISGAGPLIGPVLAAQFGYLPGLLWIVIGVCLAGATQDFLVLAASVRRGGKSLAQIAYGEIGKVAGTAAMIAILFIIVIALAGLGKVVVRALGGEKVLTPANTRLMLGAGQEPPKLTKEGRLRVGEGMKISYAGGDWEEVSGEVQVQLPPKGTVNFDPAGMATLPAGSARVFPGSPWGTFTIACTIPIAMFVGLYMYRLRKGHVVEASIIGGILTIGATVLGGWVAHQPFGQFFNLSDRQVIWAMAIYGFVAAVLPVWVLLCPRDYLSSFLKIGTIALLVVGTLIANPRLQAPAFNHAVFGGGPVVGSGSPAMPGRIFPFLFITIMCGAISGFHALVSSGTTPKMICKESDARTIGYGAMLIEGLVGVVAMVAAATLSPGDYYAMNVDLAKAQNKQVQMQLIDIGGGHIDQLNVYESRTEESLRGRVGGGVTLAVGMAHIFDQALGRFSTGIESLWKYWYHFAIMFEALFILTTIDAGTRIGRFLLQEVAGKVHEKLGRADWWPGAILSTLLIVVGWAYYITANNFNAIWSMFGIANQMLAVIALAILTVVLVNEGKIRYVWVTVAPMIFVQTTTTTAALELLYGNYLTLQTQLSKTGGADAGVLLNTCVTGGLIIVILTCAYTVIGSGIVRIWPEIRGPERGVAMATAA